MSYATRDLSRGLRFALALAVIGASGIAIWGQEAITAGNVQLRGLPDDWTHHHVVFSNPGAAGDALQKGNYAQWFTIVNEPRYVMQQLKRGLPAQGPAAGDVSRFEAAWRAAKDSAGANGESDQLKRVWRRSPMPAIDKDWSMIGGGQASVTITVANSGSGYVSSSSTITIDGQTLTGSAGTAASAAGSFSSRASSGATLTIKNGTNTLILTAGTANGTCSGSSPWSVGFNRGTSGTSSSYSSA